MAQKRHLEDVVLRIYTMYFAEGKARMVCARTARQPRHGRGLAWCSRALCGHLHVYGVDFLSVSSKPRLWSRFFFVDFSSHLIIFIGMQLQTRDSSELVRRLENSAHTVQYAAIKS